MRPSSKGRQVSFTYNSYGTDKKLHPRRDSAGNIREYIVNPYQIAAANGRYYLICNYDSMITWPTTGWTGSQT